MSDRIQGFNARDCGDWSRNPSRRPVVWAELTEMLGSPEDVLDLTITMGDEGVSAFLSREDAAALARYILSLTEAEVITS